MGRLFSIDSILYRIGITIIDLFYMNLLWIVFTIIGFGITGGASTTALFYVMLRRAEDKGNCNYKEFFYGFKKNFKKSTIVWIVLISVCSITYVNINNITFFQSIIGNTYMTMFLFAVQLLVLIEILVISIYIFSLLAMYDKPVNLLIKVAFVLGNKYFFTTLTCLALMIIVLIGLFHVPIILCSGISGLIMLTSLIIKDKIILE
ncbi:YesL family protein [Vallitalea sp.]|uniref:YesL family protein n=1 Tax=Vallitalea sp. TaxID=1882829 RepID=UPI0025F3A1F6|nr:YesL family protein [Vallitalea sp.]MCT4687718.1 YesL family protein [Vallitalea sp.]